MRVSAVLVPIPIPSSPEGSVADFRGECCVTPDPSASRECDVPAYCPINAGVCSFSGRETACN